MAEMETATRVLMAITNRVNPELSDVEELLRLAPECWNGPVDELACEIVQRAVKKRAAERTSLLG